MKAIERIAERRWRAWRSFIKTMEAAGASNIVGLILFDVGDHSETLSCGPDHEPPLVIAVRLAATFKKAGPPARSAHIDPHESGRKS